MLISTLSSLITYTRLTAYLLILVNITHGWMRPKLLIDQPHAPISVKRSLSTV